MTALPPPPARRTSLVGPVVTVAVGTLVLLVTLVLGVVTAREFVGLVRSDVLTASGDAGPAVVAESDAPGRTTATLEAGQRYAVHLAWSGGATPSLTQPVLLRAPSGDVVVADGAPGVDTESGAGRWSVVSVAAFTAPESGTYEVAVPSAGVGDARVLLAPDRDVAPFVGGIVGTIAGVFAVILLGAFGTGLVLGGVVWWVVRARARGAARPA